MNRSHGLPVLLAVLAVISHGSINAEPYVAAPSGIRWNDVGGIRWNDVGGIRWNDVGGIRWNDVGGIRWNDVGGTLVTEASGIRWNDVGGIRWNDVGGVEFVDPAPAVASLDFEILDRLSRLPDSSSINVIVTFRTYPTVLDLAQLTTLGIPGGTVFRRLPMVVVNATRGQIAAIQRLPIVRSVYANRTLSFFDQDSAALIGLDEVQTDPGLRPVGMPLTGRGVTIAVLDTGVDATHPDLPYGSKVVQNVRLMGATGSGLGFNPPARVEGVVNTDLLLGHGTFVASVAAGTGQASGGLYRGVAPGAGILSLSAGDLVILNMLEGFDYILENAARFGVKVVNCSWGTQGLFDPDDPINAATKILYDSGITVVFAAGNHGPSPDTMNPYAVAPWVIGVGSTRKDGALSGFSSRGIFEELLYHPTLVAPGEAIIAASPAALGGVNGVTGVPVPPQSGIPAAFDPWYSVASGTSFAAPHVAAAIALMLEAEPALTPAAIKQRLQQTATPILSHDRSEAGAGQLDAWAALASTLDAARPFGTHIAGWLDARPYRIVHYSGSPPTNGTVPAGGVALVPIQLSGAVLSWTAALSWGDAPGLSDLDVRLLDAAGSELARSQSLNGLVVFGRNEGIHQLGIVAPSMTLEVSFRPGTGPADQSFWLHQEHAVASITGYSDLSSLGSTNLEQVALAVSSRIMIGRGAKFEPYQSLTRGELARALALAGEVPQRIPSHATYSDVGLSNALFPYVETVSGARARRFLMEPRSTSTFGLNAPVDRIEYAVAVVRAAGRESEALAREGEALDLADETAIPSELRGFVAVALESHLIDAIQAGGGLSFNPGGSLSRLSAAQYLPRLLFK